VRERISQAIYLPAILFGFAYLTSPYHSYLPDSLSPIFEQGSYWALALMMILASLFNRAKILQLAIMVVFVHYLRSTELSYPFWGLCLTLLIPINLALISVYQERSISSLTSLFRFSLIAAQALFVFYSIDKLSHEQLNLVMDWIRYPLFTSHAAWPSLLPQSQIAFIAAVLSLGFIFVITIKRNNPISQSVFGTTLGCYLLLFVDFPSNENIGGALTMAMVLLIANGLLRDYYNMAYKDELTGLPQRRALNEHLLSLGNKYSLAMLDVDFFKKFNDTHGHDIGDQVLQMVAGRIRMVQGGGKAYRYGGEEFTVVFPGKDVEHAAYNLELVRKSIAEYEMVVREEEREDEQTKNAQKSRKKGSFRQAKKTVSVTISIGVADKQQRSEQPDDVLKRADTALYQAKKTGRNKVTLD